MGVGWVAGDPTIELPGISLEKGKEGGKLVGIRRNEVFLLQRAGEMSWEDVFF